MLRKVISLIFFGFFLSGCYANSLTMVGPATGVASGKLHHTAASTTINHVVKKQTGKTPIEHVLSEKQIKTLDNTKAKIDHRSVAFKKLKKKLKFNKFFI